MRDVIPDGGQGLSRAALVDLDDKKLMRREEPSVSRPPAAPDHRVIVSNAIARPTVDEQDRAARAISPLSIAQQQHRTGSALAVCQSAELLRVGVVAHSAEVNLHAGPKFQQGTLSFA
jgi:hypothetical protein